MTFVYVALAVYLCIGLLTAIVRLTAHDMPLRLFVFTVLFWPTWWL